MKVLVTGGVRSGKSRYAESLFRPDEAVTYLAPGPAADPTADPEWAERVAQHRARRPAGWLTLETPHLAEMLRSDGPVLIDCLGTWLTSTLDAWGAWERPSSDWSARFDEALDGVARAWAARRAPVVAVTNEVGWGVVPAYPSGRLFADLLGRTNARLAAISDDVVLMVAGRALHLPPDA